MKICFISHSSAKGGAERALLELVDALKDRGVECYVTLPSHGPLISELRNRRIDFSVFPYRWWMGGSSPMWKRIARAALNLAIVVPIVTRIKRWKCDVVYTNTITVSVGAFAARFLKLPHLWHIHEFGREDHDLIFDFGSRFSLWLMDHLSAVCVANSHAVANKYQQYIKPSKLKVVYQSVIIPQDAPAEKAAVTQEAGIRCAIIGELRKGKGQEDAIRAIGELVRLGIKAELYIVGKGNPKYREYLHILATENELNNFVKFIGYAENPFPLLQRTDVVLMCSRCEAFGRVTVEAMKMGKPVVGAKSGGTVELIREGLNGLLYTPGDYKELAENIRYLHEHPDIARQMGQNGLQWATAHFTQARYGEEMLIILRNLVE